MMLEQDSEILETFTRESLSIWRAYEPDPLGTGVESHSTESFITSFFLPTLARRCQPNLRLEVARLFYFS